MNRTIAFMAAIIMATQLSGCGKYEMYRADFSPPFKQETSVVLKENDFRFVERNLEGSYSYWTLQLGASPDLALGIPLGDPRLFSNALADMYRRSREQSEGRSTQLMNWTLDRSSTVLPIPLVWPTKETATFRADLMEFTKYATAETTSDGSTAATRPGGVRARCNVRLRPDPQATAHPPLLRRADAKTVDLDPDVTVAHHHPDLLVAARRRATAGPGVGPDAHPFPRVVCRPAARPADPGAGTAKR